MHTSNFVNHAARVGTSEAALSSGKTYARTTGILKREGATMKPQTTMNFLLAANALLLLTLVLRPLSSPAPVQAQISSNDFFIEPGIYLLRAPDNRRQAFGKVVVDLRNGNVWGFPTYDRSLPYPFNAVRTTAVTSQPFQLGRFAFESIRR
jgi:hypothetical protein